MLGYLSSANKFIRGEIKQSASDFQVEEIMADGTVLELNKKKEFPDSGSKFVHFVLEKEDWSTAEAARKIASRLRISPKRINYAGTKDKKALTTQLMSAFGVRKEDVLGLKISGMKILSAWHADEKVEMGALLGNRFKIRVVGGIDGRIVKEIVSELGTENERPRNEVHACEFPNYFGPQRFGNTRTNTHIIGEKLLKSDLRGAVESYLIGDEGEMNTYAKEARKKLRDEGDYRKALGYFPKHLKFERLMLLHLAEHRHDYANALRKLPRQILLLFVHAFQSHLFNLMLSGRLAEGKLELEGGEHYCGEKSGFPNPGMASNSGWIAGKIIGYETELNERETELLERFEMRKEDFRVQALPEINSKGTFRTLLAPMKDFEYKENVFAFSLPSGSYATSVLREFIKGLW